MTVAVFLLRAAQMHLSLDDLDGLEYGTVIDMMTESGNDDFKYTPVATQDDFDKF
ncbi:MAG: hypothetical protein J6N19_09125 [Clostridium sp.]|nr:hypothetical protein [Clostridium sp.]